MPQVDFDFEHSARLNDDDRLQYMKSVIEQTTASWGQNPLDVEFLRSCGYDEKLASELESGVVLPLIEGEEDVVQLPNHKSMAECCEHASREWDRLAGLGKVQFVGSQKPDWLWLMPCAGVIKERPGAEQEEDWLKRFKLRLIVDMRRGLVNSRLDWQQRKLKFGTLEECCFRLQKGGWQIIVDCADCFFNWPISGQSRYLLGFYDEHKKRYGFYCAVPFGLRVGPEINDSHLKEVLRCFSVGIGATDPPVDFVDDLYDTRPEKEQAWKLMESLVLFLLRAGIPPTTKKQGLVPPSQSVDYTGWNIKSVDMTVSVPPEKAEKGIDRARNVIEANKRNSLHVSELVSCVGFLNHLAQLILAGRRHLSELWGAITETGIHLLWAKRKKHDPKVQIGLDGIRELEWWIKTLAEPSALVRPIAQIVGADGSCSGSLWTARSPDFEQIEKLLRDPSVRDIATFETDASGKHGWSYVRCVDDPKVISGTWKQTCKYDADIDLEDDINTKELYVIVRLLEDLGQVLRDQGTTRIFVRSDNRNAVRCVNKRYSKDSGAMNTLCGRIDEAELEFGVLILAKHIGGKANVTSDAGSRRAEFESSYNRDPMKEVSISTKLFNAIEKRFGQKFTIDAFADPDGQNARCEQYLSIKTSAFFHDFRGEITWAFPPPAVAYDWLKKVRDDGVVGVTIIVMNKKMWRRHQLDWIEKHFVRIMSCQPNCKPFREFALRQNGSRYEKAYTCFHRIEVVRLR